MSEIIVAEHAGYCSGVKRAVGVAISAAKKHGKAYTLGQLAHNNDAVRLLEKKGVFAISGLDFFPGDGVVVIRSHGVGKNIYSRLEKGGYIYEDATCPCVRKIHSIVESCGKETAVVVVGDKEHPEVIGIKAHAEGECFVINTPEQAEELLSDNIVFSRNALIVVCQTTFNSSKWRSCAEVFKKCCTNAKIFDTICSATVKRQEEAETLSKRCDVMFVLGSAKSSNSLKLYEICSANCENTFFAENLNDINIKDINILYIKDLLYSNRELKIGITAGASVPAEIIKEVHSFMSEEMKTGALEQEIDFMAEVDKTFQKIYIGKRVKAYVVAVNKTEAVVDLGTKHSGYIPADEIGGSYGTDPDDIVSPGDEIDCIVTSINDAEGIVYLSKKQVDSAVGFEKLSAAYHEEQAVEGVVTAIVNGGAILTFEGTRVFVPASHSGVPKAGRLEELLRKNVKFKVIEINEQRSRVVGSIKAASRMENDARKVKFWEDIYVGKKFTGEIKSIESYGVFVDLGGVDGMVHLSELTWKRVKHPKELVSVGEKLDVVVKSYDPEKKRVSLTAKDPGENPWTKFTNEHSVDDTIKATVVNITPFGAFAQIIPGIDGLIHISQISIERVKNVNQVLEVGQEVEAKITEIDVEKERVSISIRALLEENGGAIPESEFDTEETEPEEDVTASEDSVESEEPIESEEPEEPIEPEEPEEPIASEGTVASED